MAAKQTGSTSTKQIPPKPKPVVPDDGSRAGAANANEKISGNLRLVVLLALVSLAVYANTLKNGYVLDDAAGVYQNTIVLKGTSAIPEILSTPYHRGFSIVPNDLYRPLSLVLFAIEYEFLGLDPEHYHLGNILLFAGCVIMLFFFIDRFFERKKTAVAFIAALIFAVHPIHTEVVANIKSCDELLCFFFAFLSLNVFLKYMQHGKMIQLLLGSFCYFLSLLSKETAFTFLAVIPLIFFFYTNEHKKRSLYITLGAVIMAGIFLWVRFSVLSAYDANHITHITMAENALAATNLSFGSRMATAVLILGKYIWLLFVPYPLICDYSYNTIPFVHFSDLRFSIAVYTFLVIYSIRGLIRNNKDPYAFAMLFFLITISLFSNIPFLIGDTMGERFLFFASTGFCLAAALLIEKWVGAAANGIAVLKHPKVLGIIIPLCLLFAFLTFDRNNEWANNHKLFTADVAKAPNSARLNYYVGLDFAKRAVKEKDTLEQHNKINEAIVYFNKAIAILPDYDEAQDALGTSYIVLNKYDSAEVHEKKAFDLNPARDRTINNLALVYYRESKFRQSLELSKKAIEINPGIVTPYTNMGYCYFNLGKSDSGVYILHKAILIDAGSVESCQALAQYYQSAGRYDSAAKYNALAKKR